MDILREENDILEVRELYFNDENSDAEKRRLNCPSGAFSV